MNAANFVPPTTIADYLERLRRALAGADPALVQDALYDAEEYLRSELAESPGKSEAEVIAAVAGSYGAPDEVAGIYRETEVTVQTALRAPAPRPSKSLLGRFFGVAADPRTYGALFYMLLALATGIFYFTWVVAGVSMSLGLAVLIIGIPFVILYFGSIRVLSLVEGRIVEVMLGERMPRRPLYSTRGQPLLQRIIGLFTDPRNCLAGTASRRVRRCRRGSCRWRWCPGWCCCSRPCTWCAASATCTVSWPSTCW